MTSNHSPPILTSSPANTPSEQYSLAAVPPLGVKEFAPCKIPHPTFPSPSSPIKEPLSPPAPSRLRLHPHSRRRRLLLRRNRLPRKWAQLPSPRPRQQQQHHSQHHSKFQFHFHFHPRAPKFNNRYQQQQQREPLTDSLPTDRTLHLHIRRLHLRLLGLFSRASSRWIHRGARRSRFPA